MTLTVTATCNGPVPATNSGSTTLTVQPVAHTLVVTANPPNPATVASGGSASLSASYSDSRTGHTIATWSWSDGGRGELQSIGERTESELHRGCEHHGFESDRDSDGDRDLQRAGSCHQQRLDDADGAAGGAHAGGDGEPA